MPPGPSALRAARPGERWVVRIRLPDGSATDLTGWVETLTDTQLQLSRAGGEVELVHTGSVVAARRAPAALGGRDPRRISAAEVERHALPGWVARSEPLGEWTLRAGGGFTGRANSCHAVGDPGMPVADAAARIVAYAAAHDIAPMAQVIDGSPPASALGKLGWTPTYEPTDVLVVRLAALLTERRPDPQVLVEEVLTDRWRAAYQVSRPNRADPTPLALILAGHPPHAFASAGGDAEAVSIARGQLSGDWLGLASIWTAVEVRRRGLATAMMVALGHWAARRRARYAYLQVASANRTASTAYGRLGFVPHHSYSYLQPPS